MHASMGRKYKLFAERSQDVILKQNLLAMMHSPVNTPIRYQKMSVTENKTVKISRKQSLK